MRRLVLPLTIVLGLVALARAQDDWKWDPKKKATPKVGARSLLENEDVRKTSTEVFVNKKIVKKQDEDTKTTSRVVCEVLAVEKGRVTKSRVKIELWKQAKVDNEPDTCLEGKTVIVEGLDEKTSYEIEGKDDDVSEDAKKWIESELARTKKHVDSDAFLAPPGPIADGGEWTGDAKACAKEMFEGAEIDAERSSVKGKLTKVHMEHGVHFGHIEVKIVLALKKLPSTPIEWTDGGVMELTATGDASLEEDVYDASTLKMEMKLVGTADVKNPNGNATIKMNMRMSGTKKEGPVEKEPEKKP